MTPEQIQAIQEMKLTREDISQVFQEMGMNFGAGTGRFANITPEQQATAQAARQNGQGLAGGGFPGGGFPSPDDIPGGAGGQGFRNGQGSNFNGQSGRSNGDNSSNDQTNPNLDTTRFGSAFYDVVIQYLQQKIDPGAINQATSQPGNQ